MIHQPINSISFIYNELQCLEFIHNINNSIIHISKPNSYHILYINKNVYNKYRQFLNEYHCVVVDVNITYQYICSVLMDLKVWDSMPHQYTIVYKPKYIFNKNFLNIEIFNEYDFIAPCKSHEDSQLLKQKLHLNFAPIIYSDNIYFINQDVMKNAIIHQNMYNLTHSQDHGLIISTYCYTQHKNIATIEVANQFAFEYGWLPNTFASHTDYINYVI